ncbi:MAG TPA: hypothetical protein P5048_00730 [Chlamydiales bacterium]|nr:hypothetical protein [Chlamydiales bacterium]
MRNGEKILCSDCFSLLHEVDPFENGEEVFVFDGNNIAISLLKQYERSWDRLYKVLASYMVLAIDQLELGELDGISPYLFDKRTILVGRQVAKMMGLKFIWIPQKDQKVLMIGLYRKNKKMHQKTLFFIKD